MCREWHGTHSENSLLHRAATGMPKDITKDENALSSKLKLSPFRSVAVYKCSKDNHGNLVIGSCIKRHLKLDPSKCLSGRMKSTNTSNEINTASNAMPPTAGSNQSFRHFQDENLVSFFRRLGFTNDGALLVTPAGLYKQTNDDNGADMDTDDASNHGDTANSDTQNTIYVYARNGVTQ